MPSREVDAPWPLDLRRTLRPLGLKWSASDADGWWRALRTPDGPTTVRFARRSDSVVRADAWGAGSDWILEHAPAWLGAHDDPCAFHTDHPVVGPLHRRRRGVRFGATGRIFEAVAYAVIGQKVTGREASRSLRGLTWRFSEPAPGPRGLRLPPDPDVLAAQPYHALHDLGIEKKRVDTLIGLARRHRRLETLAGSDVGEAARVLLAFRGVGAWTVAETLSITHGDADAVSVGDYHHKHIVSWHLAGEPRGSDDRMLELLDEFRPHRGRVVRLLESAGGYPKYGPRMPIRNIAGM